MRADCVSLGCGMPALGWVESTSGRLIAGPMCDGHLARECEIAARRYRTSLPDVRRSVLRRQPDGRRADGGVVTAVVPVLDRRRPDYWLHRLERRALTWDEHHYLGDVELRALLFAQWGDCGPGSDPIRYTNTVEAMAGDDEDDQ